MEHSKNNNHNHEPVDMDTSPYSEAGESSAQPTQITSIDGFFNRKRGRPPKNRFVEVYKSAQHSPQAIFTSFKLEKNDQSNVSGYLAPAEIAEISPTSLRLANQTSQGDLVATDLTPSRTRKRGRVWNVESQRDLSLIAPISHEKTRSTTKMESSENRLSSQLNFAAANVELSPAISQCLDRVSVVRAAGTFYPENANTASAAESAVETAESTRSKATTTAITMEQPEDLSMRGNTAATSGGRDQSPEAGLKLLQFKQLIDLYQRQWLLPTFLAAASQQQPSVALDMRLLLENAAQQKMLLLNAASAAAASAAVAAAAAAANSNTNIDSTTNTTTTTTTTAEKEPIAEIPAVRAKRCRDQDIPTGYLKFRFNEDCGFERCGYRNHQSHFHCNRRDCHYSFCDKTRFVQHTARHERMDNLMGDDFRQYRANMHCGYTDCCYDTPTTMASNCRSDDIMSLSLVAVPKKSSHFHCRKCDYVCTDSNKVVAHRRLHMRLEYVRSAGFRKIASNESCSTPSCSYTLRHTHYHCITCDCSVLSRAQLASHRHRVISQTTKQQLPESLAQEQAEAQAQAQE